MQNHLVLPIANLPRSIKRLIALSFDAFLCVFTVWFAYALRLEEFVRLSDVSPWPIVAALAISLPIFITTGFYRAIFRYSGWSTMITLGKAASIYAVAYGTLFTMVGVDGVPRTVGIIQPILLFFGVAASRGMVRQLIAGLLADTNHKNGMPSVLIYGAGSAGRQLALGLQQSYEMRVVGFIDDDVTLHNNHINSLSIYDPAKLAQIITDKNIDTVLLALPSVTRTRRQQIVENLLQFQLNVRTLPGLADLAYGKVTVNDLQEIDITDLLGRDPVTPNQALLHQNVTGKVVLVTGAGGSIGSELCRQVLALEPVRLVLVEFSEYALYSIHAELESRLPESNADKIVPIMASVCDEARMAQLFELWQPDTVYHAAAYKHVPLVEANPCVGIRNNVFGTLSVAKAAANADVANFVMISTDKAVRPTNVMGASKRLAEMVIQSLAVQKTKTCFSMVRFGNVLGSSGSVIPRFRQQILSGGPITLTHKDIIRYFMTIPEAVQLVIQAGAMAKGGEVFVLDMGEPVRILDLAERMIQLHGLTLRDANNPHGDIEIKVTGLRPGEKLYEELLIEEGCESSGHPRIMIAYDPFQKGIEASPAFEVLEISSELNDAVKCVVTLRGLIGFEPVLAESDE